MLRKTAIVLMLLLELLTILLTSFGVGIFASILFVSTHFVCAQFDQIAAGAQTLEPLEGPMRDNAVWIATGATAVYLACYLLFLFVHRVKGTGKAFVGWAWGLIIFLNLLLLGVLGASLVLTWRGASLASEHDTLDLGRRCVNPLEQWATVVSRCGTASESPSCDASSDCVLGAELTCEANVCPAKAVTMRCGHSWELADETCGATCAHDSDCDASTGEACFNNLAPNGCGASGQTLAVLFGVAYPFIPILFAAAGVLTSGQSAAEASLAAGSTVMQASLITKFVFLRQNNVENIVLSS